MILILLPGALKSQNKQKENGEMLNQAANRIIVFKDSTYKTGTFFFFNFSDTASKEFETYIVTNRHVVEDAEKVLIKVNYSDTSGQNPMYGNSININLSELNSEWIYHPDSLDLAILNVNEIFEKYNTLEKKLFARTIPTSLIPPEEVWSGVGILEEVVMIGCPNGIIDNYNNVSIARFGMTASQPTLDYNGRPEFLIDIAAYPGSSGSPVFLRRTSVQLGAPGSNYPLNFGIYTGYYFIGVLYGGPVYNVMTKSMEIKDIDSIDFYDSEKVSLPINLGAVIKSKTILDFKQLIDE